MIYLKRQYIMTIWIYTWKCKFGLTFNNESVQFTISTDGTIKPVIISIEA